VLSGDKTLNEITLHTAGLDVIPGITGLTSFISLSKEQQIRLQNSMLQLQAEYDYLIIDNTAGISNSVRYYTKISDYVIIVITPDPASLSAAFSLIRVLQKRGNAKKYQIMVNNVSDEVYAKRIFNRFFTPIEKHIGCKINYLGCVISDEMLPASICLQNPVVLEYPTSASAFSFRQLARQLILFPEKFAENQQHHSEQKAQPKQLSDFLSNTTTLDVDEQKITKQAVSQPVSTKQLKEKIISNINNEQLEEHKLKKMVLEINSAYSKRFGYSAVDLPHVIHDALKMNHLSEQTLRNLLMTLYSFYQDQFGKKPAAENTISTTTSLTQDSVNLLIKLLQQENISNLPAGLQQNSISPEQKTPQLLHPAEKTSPQLNELLESIRLASMVDN
jgi:MinD-like ATPase involved in chromosome partitioning or flagellar assembly